MLYTVWYKFWKEGEGKRGEGRDWKEGRDGGVLPE